MELIPAIDIMEGRCVRLYRGDFGRRTVFSEDPVEVARRWARQGATRIHVVDLDGARRGVPVNLEAVEAIVAAVDVPVQMGGGIRDLATARQVLDAGVQRVILGTAALEDPDLVEEACRLLGTEAVVVAVDARDGRVAVRGWTRSSHVPATRVVGDMEARGVVRFLYTDIARDGTLEGPNFDGIRDLKAQTSARLLVAGGVATLDHLRRLTYLGVEGAVVGKALYTGDLDLVQALRTVGVRGEDTVSSP